MPHRYFSNTSRSSTGLKNHLSFRLFTTLKALAVVEYRLFRPNGFLCHRNWNRNQMKTWHSTLLRISVINALTVYKIATSKNINIRIFRRLLGFSESTLLNNLNFALYFINTGISENILYADCLHFN